MIVSKSLRLGAIAIACLPLSGIAQSAAWAGSHSSSPAGETWAQEHPRQEEVIQRVEHQEQHIDQAYAEKKLSSTQEKQLLDQDNKILSQDKSMAAANGGYITKAQKKSLNQELNANGANIKADSAQ